MANINPIRRAEIGREKRARTRAQLVTAANSLFASQAVESITVDDVVREAGVAKGTFYVHFDSLEALIAAVAEELDVSHETIRFWWNRFGPMFAAEIRRKRAQRMQFWPQWQWHLGVHSGSPGR